MGKNEGVQFIIGNAEAADVQNELQGTRKGGNGGTFRKIPYGILFRGRRHGIGHSDEHGMDGTRLHGMHAVLAVHRRKAFNDETASLPCIQRAADGRSLPHAQASLVQFRVESVNGSSVLEKDGSVHGIAFRTGLVDRQYVPVVLPPDAVVKDQGAAVPGVKAMPVENREWMALEAPPPPSAGTWSLLPRKMLSRPLAIIRSRPSFAMAPPCARDASAEEA